MQLEIHLTGVSPLVMEHPRLSDPDDEISRTIKGITDKRTKTEEDRREIDRLKFLGSLYLNSQGPFVPGLNLRACWYEVGKGRRLGTAVERAVLFQAPEYPLEYEGPRDAGGLWALETSRFRAMVGHGSGKNKSRIPRMRPMFLKWRLAVPIELLTQYLDRDQFVEIVTDAGLIEGLMGARHIGYGRYTAVVKG